MRSLRGRIDIGLAAMLVGVGELQVWAGWNDGGVGHVPAGHHSARAALVVALALPGAWRRRYPLLCAGMTCVGIGLQLAVVAYVPFLAGLLPMAIANYTAAAYAPRWNIASLLAVLATEAGISGRIPEERAAGELLFSIFVALGTWVAGDVVRVRLRRAEVAVREAESVVAEHEAATTQVLAEERARIARELHDVIAHSVSVMGVQAGAARALLDADPAGAHASLLAIEATARSSVGELKRLLAVLRDETEGQPARSPQPGLAQLPALVGQVRRAGLPVELSIADCPTLPAGIDLAAYRIVQEALTNALKHSGAATRVDVRPCHGSSSSRSPTKGPVARSAPTAAGTGLSGCESELRCTAEASTSGRTETAGGECAPG
jgi:signal transduction histidine kinase